MSIRVMEYVWKSSAHAGSELLVLLALADWSDDYGVCYPNVATIAQKSRIGERQVINVIHALEASGELYVRRGHGRACSRYLLVMARPAAELAPILMERFQLDKAAALALATQLAEVKRSSPLAEGCNPVHLSGAAGFTSEVKSSAKKKAEFGAMATSPRSDPSIDPSSDPSESAANAATPSKASKNKKATKVSTTDTDVPQRMALLAVGEMPATVGKARNWLSDVIAFCGYGMKRGDSHTSVSANRIIADQLGETPSLADIALLTLEVWDMYAWWKKDGHDLDAPVKPHSVISALKKYRDHLAKRQPVAPKPAAAAPPMIVWVRDQAGNERPLGAKEFESDFPKSWSAPAPSVLAEVRHD